MWFTGFLNTSAPQSASQLASFQHVSAQPARSQHAGLQHSLWPACIHPICFLVRSWWPDRPQFQGPSRQPSRLLLLVPRSQSGRLLFLVPIWRSGPLVLLVPGLQSRQHVLLVHSWQSVPVFQRSSVPVLYHNSVAASCFHVSTDFPAGLQSSSPVASLQLRSPISLYSHIIAARL